MTIKIFNYDDCSYFTEAMIYEHFKICWEESYPDLPMHSFTKDLLYKIKTKGITAIHPDGTILLIAANNTNIIGTLVFTQGDIVDFWGMYVNPNTLGQGVGSQLLKRMQETAGNFVCLRASVLAHKPKTRAFYRKNGFTEVREVEMDLGNENKINTVVIEKRVK